MIARRTVLVSAVAAGIAPAAAQDVFPSRPISIVVGFPPGGGTDVLARIFADRMTPAIGQRVLVDNRPGAGGTIAASQVARAAADGYTLMAGTVSTHGIAPHLYRGLSYDSLKAFEPVALLTIAPIVLVAHPDLPANTIPELVALLKANPGKFDYATGGNGTHAHLATEMFKSEAGVDLTHVPYRGGGPALQAVLSGEVKLIVDNLQTALPHLQAGKLKALAIMSAARSSASPSTPTMVESGFKEFVTDSWMGFYAPIGTPAPILDKLRAAAVAAQRDEFTRKRLGEMFVTAASATAQELDAITKLEHARWGAVIRKLDLKAE